MALSSLCDAWLYPPLRVERFSCTPQCTIGKPLAAIWLIGETMSPYQVSLLGYTATFPGRALHVLEVLGLLATFLWVSEQCAALPRERGVVRKRRRLYVFVVTELFSNFVYHARALIESGKLSARLCHAPVDVFDSRARGEIVRRRIGGGRRERHGAQQGRAQQPDGDARVA